MAIPCPGCGREYDVTLFQFGRTIHCTCGARVGLEKRVGPELSSSRPRFFADAMLGGLARWLRILGFDTAYDPAVSDRDLVRRGVLEGRHILSKDRGLPEAWRVAQCFILESDESEAQLREVVERFDLRRGIRLFTRCTVCNSPLDPIPKDVVRDRVPDRVAESRDSFHRCPDCGRIYWEGSHTERMRGRLREILGD
jgi:uncharacterized protein with PIN domain